MIPKFACELRDLNHTWFNKLVARLSLKFADEFQGRDTSIAPGPRAWFSPKAGRRSALPAAAFRVRLPWPVSYARLSRAQRHWYGGGLHPYATQGPGGGLLRPGGPGRRARLCGAPHDLLPCARVAKRPYRRLAQRDLLGRRLLHSALAPAH